MKVLKLLIVINFLLAGTVLANDKDNGGDICGERILSIRSDLRLWIHKNEYKQMRFYGGIKESLYKTKMLQAMNDAVVSCTTKTVSIGESEKTCINSYDEKLKKPIIKCNFSRFQKTNESKQYRLVHHEFAGVAGLEVNDAKEESNYYFSKQIIGFLKDATIKKLVVNNYDYPKSNYLEVRAEFKRRYECGTYEDASEKYYCESGLRNDSLMDSSGQEIELHILKDIMSLKNIEKIVTKKLKHISRSKVCSKSNEFCMIYYILENDTICELLYHESGESVFNCLERDNELSYSINAHYFLPMNTIEPGENLENYLDDYSLIETSIVGAASALYAPISKEYGDDVFPKSEKTNKLVKAVNKLFKTPGTKKISSAEITSASYIGFRVQLQYRKTGRFTIDLEDFAFGDQGYSSLYVFEDEEGESVCWSNSQDEDDDMNICFNADGTIDYTYLYFG